MAAGMAETTSTGVPRCRFVDGVDDGDAGVALAPELDVEHHHVVAFAGDRRLGVVAVEPGVDLDAGLRGLDPALELIARSRGRRQPLQRWLSGLSLQSPPRSHAGL
jgi:hypothetical protein